MKVKGERGLSVAGIVNGEWERNGECFIRLLLISAPWHRPAAPSRLRSSSRRKSLAITVIGMEMV